MGMTPENSTAAASAIAQVWLSLFCTSSYPGGALRLSPRGACRDEPVDPQQDYCAD